MKRDLCRGLAAGLSVVGMAAGFTGCSKTMASVAPDTAPPPAPVYTPGLGDIMTLIQQRHAKLFYAGQAGNWALANYELHELNEGLNDVVTFYPTFKTFNFTTLVPGTMGSGLGAIQDAVTKQDSVGFVKAFGQVTQSCTQCHSTTNHGFITIQVPTNAVEYSNLRFEN